MCIINQIKEKFTLGYGSRRLDVHHAREAWYEEQEVSYLMTEREKNKLEVVGGYEHSNPPSR